MGREGSVTVYLTPRIKRLLKIEAVNREASMGSIMGEAALAWIKFLKEIEIKNQREAANKYECEKLENELNNIQSELDIVRNERKEAIERRRRMFKK